MTAFISSEALKSEGSTNVGTGEVKFFSFKLKTVVEGKIFLLTLKNPN